VVPTEFANLGRIGQLIIGGFSPLGVDVFNFPQDRKNNTLQFADALRLQVRGGGLHDLAFGTDIRRTTSTASSRVISDRWLRSTEDSAPTRRRFARGRPDLPTRWTSPPAAPRRAFFQSLKRAGTTDDISLSYYQLNFFAQDNWRPREI
jgi:hypothetical protein